MTIFRDALGVPHVRAVDHLSLAFEPDAAVSAESNRSIASSPSVSRTCSFQSSRGNIENSAWLTSMIPSGTQGDQGSSSRPAFTPAT